MAEQNSALQNPMLVALWQRNLPTLRERLDQLDAAAAAAQTHTLDPVTREAAAGTAHKLSGSLGMFGYPEGTDAARAIEHLLESPIDPDPTELATLTQHLRKAVHLG